MAQGAAEAPSSVAKADRPVPRKLVDSEGNQYMFEVAPDADAHSVADVLMAHDQQLAKLIAFKLRNDVWKDLNHAPIGPAAARYSHPAYKLVVTDKQEEFSVRMKRVLDVQRERNERINRPKVTHYQGAKIQHDANGAYVVREQRCHANGGCKNVIVGVQRIGMEDGKVKYAQTFTPTTEGAVRVREGSKYFFCPECAPRRIDPEMAQYSASSGVSVKGDKFVASEAPESAIFIPNIEKGLDYDLQMRRLEYLTSAKTDSQLAKALAVTPFSVYQWKSKRGLSIRVIWEFCYLSGYSFDWIMTGDGVPRINTLKSLVDEAIMRPAPKPPEPEETIEEKVNKFALNAAAQEKVKLLSEMSAPGNNITGEYFKGFSYAVLPTLLDS